MYVCKMFNVDENSPEGRTKRHKTFITSDVSNLYFPSCERA